MNCRTSRPGTAGRAAAGRRTRWYAKGPVYLDQTVRVAGKGGYAVVVWVAVQARSDGAGGRHATTTWIAKVTGLNVRAIQKAVAALVEAGVLKRDGDKISTPSYAKER
jgi:hypothetical protein